MVCSLIQKNRSVHCLFLILLLGGSSYPLFPLQSFAESQSAPQIRTSSATQQAQSPTSPAPGVEYQQITRGEESPNETTGPWSINILRVDPSLVSLQVFHALDEGVGLETTSSLATRHKAVAAINGGYFRTTGTFRGESVGTLMLDGNLISEPHHERAALGLMSEPKTTGIVLGHLKFGGEISMKRSPGARRGQPVDF